MEMCLEYGLDNNDYRDIKLQSTRKSFEKELQPFVQEEAGTFNQ